MPESNEDYSDGPMLIFNLVGITVAVGLLGAFFCLYGDGFLGLILLLSAPQQMWPDH